MEEFRNFNNELFRVLAEFGMTVVPMEDNQPRVHIGGDRQEPCQVPMLPEMELIPFDSLDEILEDIHRKAKEFVSRLPMLSQRTQHLRFCIYSEIHESIGPCKYEIEVTFLDIA